MATAPARKPAAAPAAAAKKPAAKPAEAANEAAPAKPAKRSRSRGLLLGLLLLVAAGAAGGWYYFDQAQGSDPAKAAAPEPKKHPVFVPVDSFTVNLSTVSIDRYLQLGVTFEMVNGSAAEELKRQMPVVRSRILLLLAAKTAEDLATTAGKQKLMTELLAEARAPLPAGESPTRGVENVHFSSFVIQ